MLVAFAALGLVETLLVLPGAEGLVAKTLAGGSGGVLGSEPSSGDTVALLFVPEAGADGGGWTGSALTVWATPGKNVSFDWRSVCFDLESPPTDLELP